MSSRSGTVILLAGAATALACSTHMARVNRALGEYDASLVLSAYLDPANLKIGEDVDLRLTLRSRRVEGVVAACLGVSRRYLLSAVPLETRERRQPIAESGSLVDHPHCKQRFVLGPGEELSWSEKLRVLDIGSGAAELRAWVQVVHPKDCERLYGCYDTMIPSGVLSVTLSR